MIKSVKIGVKRNFDKFLFSPAISKEKRLEILKVVEKACNSFEGKLAGKFYNLESDES
jgi:protein-arginine kinase